VTPTPQQRRERFRAGLCGECGKPRDTERLTCNGCLSRQAVRRAAFAAQHPGYHTAYSRKRRAAERAQVSA
jgi:hypothetical protein